MSQTSALFPPESPPPYVPSFFTATGAFRIGFGAWLRYFVAFTAMSLVLHAPLLAWAYQAYGAARWDVDRWNRMSLWLTLGEYVIAALLSAMVIPAVCARLEGRPASIAQVISTGVRRALPALAVAMLVGILVGIGTLALWVPGVIVSCMLYVATPASVVERPGIIGALKRSAKLTKGARGSIFGLSILTGIVMLVGTMVLHGSIIGFADERMHLMPISSLATDVLLAPLLASIVAAAYVLLRRERDGVAVDEIVRVFD